MNGAVQAFQIYEEMSHGDLISYNTEQYVQDILDFLKTNDGEDLTFSAQAATFLQ
jgi:hypothetical protein